MDVKYVPMRVIVYFVSISSSDHLRWIYAVYLAIFFMVVSIIYGQPHPFSATETVLKDSIQSVHF